MRLGIIPPTQSDALAEADDDSSSHEAADVVTWAETLDECGNNDQGTTNTHTDLAAEIVRNRTSKEEATDDGANSIYRIDQTNQVGIRLIEVCDPVLRALHRVVNRGIVPIQHHACCCDE